MSGRKIPNAELKTAIYAELNGNIDYDVIESSWIDQEYPLVHIGEMFASPWDSKGEPGAEITQRFHLWSKVDSEEEVSEMMQQVCDKIGLSNDSTQDHITLTNWNVVSQTLDSFDSISTIDDKMPLRHGILDIRFVLEQK